jgi:hypothetical protein
MEETVLVYERDWEIIKETQLAFVDEDQRDALLESIVKMAVYN